MMYRISGRCRPPTDPHGPLARARPAAPGERAAHPGRTQGLPPPGLGRGPTTSPGVEPGPSTEGLPDGARQTAVWGRHGQGLGSLALTLPLPPPCRGGARRRAGYVPACKGSVDSLAARTCPCPELAAASTVACPPPAYKGEHLSREAAPRAGAFLGLGIPASQPDARLWGGQHGPTPARVRCSACVAGPLRVGVSKCPVFTT
jgi:hypothetical protein